MIILGIWRNNVIGVELCSPNVSETSEQTDTLHDLNSRAVFRKLFLLLKNLNAQVL